LAVKRGSQVLGAVYSPVVERVAAVTGKPIDAAAPPVATAVDEMDDSRYL